MSQPSPLRRWTVTLSLVAAAVASIATSPPDTLWATLHAEPFELTADQPTITRHLRVRLELDKGLEGRDASARLALASAINAVAGGEPADAGTTDAGSDPAARPIVQFIVRDAAHPEVEIHRGDSTLELELMRECDQRICEQTLIVEWGLGEGSAVPVGVEPRGELRTVVGHDEGVASLELLP